MNSRESFIEAVAQQAQITKAEAERVTDYYLKIKVLRFDGVDGSTHLQHGAFLDRDVLLRALDSADCQKS